jgi:ATP-dependent DNA ligase
MPSQPPKWIKPQLTRLVEEAPAGANWLHEIKYDGYRVRWQARLSGRTTTPNRLATFHSPAAFPTRNAAEG